MLVLIRRPGFVLHAEKIKNDEKQNQRQGA
jgi:hypothetical protein